jgi:hypothetical protein
MRKIRKSEWIAITGALLLINGLTLWCIDVSLTAMLNQKMIETAQAVGIKPIGDYGLASIFQANPVITYHLAIYINLILTFIMFMIILHVVMKNEKEK